MLLRVREIDWSQYSGISSSFFKTTIESDDIKNKKYNMQEQIPYESAKPMYLVDDIDNKEILKEIIIETCKDLQSKK